MSAGCVFAFVSIGMHNPPEEENNNRETGGVMPVAAAYARSGKE